jgi:hypothetical protein
MSADEWNDRPVGSDESTEPSGAPPSPCVLQVDRRTHPRHLCVGREVTIYLQHPTRTLHVTPRNISVSGIQFLAHQLLSPDATCIVEFASDSADSLKVGARIARCRYVGGLVHDVAVSFKTPLDPAFIEAFLYDEPCVDSDAPGEA